MSNRKKLYIEFGEKLKNDFPTSLDFFYGISPSNEAWCGLTFASITPVIFKKIFEISEETSTVIQHSHLNSEHPDTRRIHFFFSPILFEKYIKGESD